VTCPRDPARPGGRTVHRVFAGRFPGYSYARRDRLLLEQWTRERPLVRPLVTPADLRQ